MNTTEASIVIVGGGAAGFFSAIHNKLAFPDADVIIIEKTKRLLSKVKISGGGRCNVTHACFDPRELTQFYPRGSKELLGAFHQFQPRDTMAWFESRGVKLKIEDDNRMFPVSNASSDIMDCLLNTARKLGVKIWTQCSIESISKKKSGFLIALKDGQTQGCEKLVLASGSHPDGYAYARQFGHSIQDPVPSLFTFVVQDRLLHELKGLSVSDVQVHLASHKKRQERGALLITHWGLSGPGIITLSAFHARFLHESSYRDELVVDFFPDFTVEDLLLLLEKRQSLSAKRRLMAKSPFSELPGRLWVFFLLKQGFSENISWEQWTRKSMLSFCTALKQWRFLLEGKGVFKEEFVTCGGVTLNEINFKTMESKRCPGLHIIGELLDIDGVTGGFNFQNAWTTGFLSAQ